MLNDFYTNINIKEFFKRYGFANAIRRGIYTKWPVHFVYDYEMRKVLWQEKIAKKMYRYTQVKEDFISDIKFNDLFDVDNPIWFFWNSGIESAPVIVKKCYRSIVDNVSQDVIVLNDSNIDEYVELPNWIKKKRHSGNLPLAHYTDLLRLALLYKYGGTWVDSTVYLTDTLGREIINSEFFALRNSLCLLNNPALYAVWFIHANPQNDIIKRTLNASLAYWKKENHIQEYLMTNILMTMIIYECGYDSTIPYQNTDYSEYLMKKLGDAFSEKDYEWIKALTNIHKLSYKLDKNIGDSDTYYTYIVK